MLNIPILHGTGREGNKSAAAATFTRALVRAAGVESELFHAADVSAGVTIAPKQPHPKLIAWREAMAKADGLIIVTPEYNHGYPGELKMALDALRTELAYKPVAVCGVSNGGFGGVRVIDHLRITLVEQRMIPMRDAVAFSKIDDLFDTAGNSTDPDLAKRFDPMMRDLLWYAELLKGPRAEKMKG